MIFAPNIVARITPGSVPSTPPAIVQAINGLPAPPENFRAFLVPGSGNQTFTGSWYQVPNSGGKVTVNIHPSEEITDTSTSVNYVFLEVSDTGIGIPPEYQEKIFTPFFRVDKSRSRAMGGAGLGLALVSEIVRQHNGQVKVLESSKKGSMIAIMLPV